MDYSESLAYLEQIQEEGAKFSLDNIQIIIDDFPFDLQTINFIQVGGTNGKGSTSHGIATVLSEGGYRVGLFTSPHLLDVRERIEINKKLISQNDFASCLTQVKDLTDNLLKRGIIPNKPSYFETILLIALLHFYREKTDFAVLEVGLGGRLDATSAIKPVLSVITNVNYDHMKILGNKLSDIAAEKAGIVKSGVPLVCACKPKTAGFRVIKQHCSDLQAPFIPVFAKPNHLTIHMNSDNRPFFNYSTSQTSYCFSPGMNGQHQVYNSATCICTAEILNRQGLTQLSKDVILSGITKTHVPGRMEWFKTNPPILIDGGHNLAGVKALASYLCDINMKDMTLIFGVLKDKQYQKMINEIKPFVKRVILTEPKSHRAKPARQLQRFFSPISTSLQLDYLKALDEALSYSEPILITGSLYLIGYLRDKIETVLQHSSMEVPS